MVGVLLIKPLKNVGDFWFGSVPFPTQILFRFIVIAVCDTVWASAIAWERVSASSLTRMQIATAWYVRKSLTCNGSGP